MAETITIGTITFVVAPEEIPEPKPAPKPKPKPKQRKRPSAPQCTASRNCGLASASVQCSDGLYRMNYQAAAFEHEKKKGRLERWGILKTWEK